MVVWFILALKWADGIIPHWIFISFTAFTYLYVFAIVIVWLGEPNIPLLRWFLWPLFRNKALVDIKFLFYKNVLVYYELYKEIDCAKSTFVLIGWEAFCRWKIRKLEDKWIHAKYLRAV
jgi:hypothetical protein